MIFVCVENPHGFQLFILKRSLKKVEVSVCLSLTAFPSPLHRNSWVDCPWQVAEMLSLLFPEFDSLMSVFSLIVFHHVECFKSVYIGYTMVTPWLHLYIFVWLRWLHGWAKAAESGGLLSMLPFGWHLATSSLAFEGPFTGLYMAVLSYWVILVCQKRCHDVKSRWNVYVQTEAGILAFQCLGMQYELIGYRLWLTVACHSKTYASSARACDSRWFWCISYIFIHAPQCCKFSSCFVILVFWDEGPRHTRNA